MRVRRIASPLPLILLILLILSKRSCGCGCRCRSRAQSRRERVDLLDAALMTSTIEWRREPGVEDLDRVLLAHHALADREHVGVVVRAAELCGLDVPGEDASDAAHAIGDDRLAVARAA